MSQHSIYVHEKEQHLLGDPKENLSGLWSKPYTMQADKTVKEGDVLHLADFEIHVLATPGHTAGGVCYYIPAEKTLFSGDTLFCESYGRYDFPTSSGRELTASVKRLLKELPGDVTVYPGHILMGDWKTCWFIFAGYALVVAVAFAVLFRPKKEQK